MGKELEELKNLFSFVLEVAENMVGLSKGEYDEKYFVEETGKYLKEYVKGSQIVELYKYLEFLDLFITLHNRAHVYDEEGEPLKVLQVLNCDTIVVRKGQGEKIFLPIKDYKQKFWLNKDKSE